MNNLDNLKQNELAKDRDLFYKLEKQKKDIEQQENELRKKLLTTMKKNNITKIENDNILISYVDETTREDFDKKKLKQEQPKVYNKYIKIVSVKSSLRIKLK